jgi:hypothetical protein
MMVDYNERTSSLVGVTFIVIHSLGTMTHLKLETDIIKPAVSVSYIICYLTLGRKRGTTEINAVKFNKMLPLNISIKYYVCVSYIFFYLKQLY